MALTDTEVKAAKPKDRDYKMAEGRGLYLQVSPSGGKLWRFKYRIDGREKKLALGKYPETSLAEARQKREAARRTIASGKGPFARKEAEQDAAANRGRQHVRRHRGRILPEAATRRRSRLGHDHRDAG